MPAQQVRWTKFGAEGTIVLLIMPTLSTFFGISVRMYYNDHPPPHFHVHYAGHEAQVSIETLDVISGSLPRRALVLVVEWALAHRDELRDDWRLAAAHQPLLPIAPLE